MKDRLEEIEKEFNKLDMFYLELYDMQKTFNRNKTAYSKKVLEKYLIRFRKQFKRYDRIVSNLWINENWGGE